MNKDVLSKSDPILQIMLEGPAGFVEVGRTECIQVKVTVASRFGPFVSASADTCPCTPYRTT